MDLMSRLKKIIQELGLKNDEFAEKCGISKPQIYKYLSGVQEPGTKFYRNLKINYPSVDIGWLITGIGEMIQENKDNYPNGEFIGLDLNTKEQTDILKGFEDQEAIIEMNKNLLYLEKRSKASFEKARNIIIGLKEGTAVATEQDYKQKVRKEKKELNLPPVKERLKKAAG
jgi:transcriptional regulator with XRE-family HTH domain